MVSLPIAHHLSHLGAIEPIVHLEPDLSALTKRIRHSDGLVQRLRVNAGNTALDGGVYRSLKGQYWNKTFKKRSNRHTRTHSLKLLRTLLNLRLSSRIPALVDANKAGGPGDGGREHLIGPEGTVRTSQCAQTRRGRTHLHTNFPRANFALDDHLKPNSLKHHLRYPMC